MKTTTLFNDWIISIFKAETQIEETQRGKNEKKKTATKRLLSNGNKTWNRLQTDLDSDLDLDFD